jgi:hypothetical protein
MEQLVCLVHQQVSWVVTHSAHQVEKQQEQMVRSLVVGVLVTLIRILVREQMDFF